MMKSAVYAVLFVLFAGSVFAQDVIVPEAEAPADVIAAESAAGALGVSVLTDNAVTLAHAATVSTYACCTTTTWVATAVENRAVRTPVRKTLRAARCEVSKKVNRVKNRLRGCDCVNCTCVNCNCR